MSGILSRVDRQSGPARYCSSATKRGDEGLARPDEAPAGWESFVYGLIPGRPLVAATADGLVWKLASTPLDSVIIRVLPPGSQREMVAGDHGYYCRVLVPLPNELPDAIAVL